MTIVMTIVLAVLGFKSGQSRITTSRKTPERKRGRYTYLAQAGNAANMQTDGKMPPAYTPVGSTFATATPDLPPSHATANILDYFGRIGPNCSSTTFGLFEGPIVIEQTLSKRCYDG
ncbi:MAG: hypothetical protein ACREV4_15730 [Gammaproteobacteria bacterium]